MTRSNLTSLPSAPDGMSQRMTSPSATLYCLPPVSMIAYITKVRYQGRPPVSNAGSDKCGQNGHVVENRPLAQDLPYEPAGRVRCSSRWMLRQHRLDALESGFDVSFELDQPIGKEQHQ